MPNTLDTAPSVLHYKQVVTQPQIKLNLNGTMTKLDPRNMKQYM
jgi:hypothetical protein